MEDKITRGKLHDLIQDDRNLNKGTERGQQLIEKSLREFGAGRSILLDKNNRIIAGNKTHKNAELAGLDDVIIVETDGTKLVAVKRTDVDLDTKQGREMALADNATVKVDLQWDTEQLESVAEDFGIDTEEWDVEIDEMPLDLTEPTEDEFDEAKDDVQPVAQRGDVFVLGEHRLMCGDSTDADAVAKLMNGEQADMTFTDPPYNIAYSGVNDKRTIKNDKMSEDDFVDFLSKSIMKLDTAYVCCSWQYAHLFKRAMENIGMPPKAMIVWNKVHAAQHLDKYYKQHELIWYFGKFGGQKTLRGDIWEVPREPNTVHPTMKPLTLIGIALQDQPDKVIVYDGFGGSGSTMMACEQLGRKCRMMELDPHYCDIIIARWEKMTGKKAVKLDGNNAPQPTEQ